MPIVFRKKLKRNAEFALWKIDEPADAMAHKLVLSDEAGSAFWSYKSQAHALQWLASRLLLQSLTGSEGPMAMQTDAHEKPFLTHFPHYFSISHSHEYAAVIVSKNHWVGIDIEWIKTKIERLATKFLSAEELNFIGEDKIHHLYACWCAKEALYKLLGKKNISLLQNIHLHPFPIKPEGDVRAVIQHDGFFKALTVRYFFFEGYAVAYCLDG